jgi:putative FmdB family regulatory protein
MPIYEYQCPRCDCRFELMRPLSKSEELGDCPKCKFPSKRAMSRFVSRSKSDLSMLSHMPSSSGSGGSSCSGCSSGNCSTCGGG